LIDGTIYVGHLGYVGHDLRLNQPRRFKRIIARPGDDDVVMHIDFHGLGGRDHFAGYVDIAV